MSEKGRAAKGSGTRRSMPAGAEAVRAERAARRAVRAEAGGRAEARPAVPDTTDGSALIRATWCGTILFALGAVVAAIVPPARLAVALLDVALFVVGCGLFFWTLVVAARRSREVEIGLWNLFLLEAVAPKRVRVRMLAPIGIEVAVALATAWIAGPLAFGILVPVWALGWSGLWGAKYGRFTVPRQASRPRRARDGTANAES